MDTTWEQLLFFPKCMTTGRAPGDTLPLEALRCYSLTRVDARAYTRISHGWPGGQIVKERERPVAVIQQLTQCLIS
jgi:hypothetical protein